MLVKDLKLRVGQTESDLLKICEKRLRAPVKYFKILKKSLDARDKGNIAWVYTVECSSKPVAPVIPVYRKITKDAPRVYIAGAGPAGIFCALRLIDHGIRPVLLERGRKVEERVQSVEKFCRGGTLDPESNVQFGEGGAGTFSDGKLNTQTNNPLNREVLERFVSFGAPEEIAYLNKPHVGSDKLRSVVTAMRRRIEEAGGEVRFSSRLDGIGTANGALEKVRINGEWEDADELVLAIGHSARDTFEMLLHEGFAVEQKEFAAGVRVEHLQRRISESQYGKGYEALPPADYKLVSHASERAAFTFCMCPGGTVVPAASEEGGIAVNGMSNYDRGGRNANSALVVQVRREDFGSEHPLAGVEFQRKIERAAYRAAGGYRAPVQLMGDFLSGKESYYFGEVQPTYPIGTAFVPMDALLPPVICASMRAAAADMDRRLAGFGAYDAVLTGVETRTSSPVRIVRGEDLQAIGKAGVYPCGEGCGYAGGITSAAADGIRVAVRIAGKYF